MMGINNIEDAIFITNTTQMGNKAILKKNKKNKASLMPPFMCCSQHDKLRCGKSLCCWRRQKRATQAEARKKCQTKGICLVTRLLPLITQHYCLYPVQLELLWMKWGNKERKWENKHWGLQRWPLVRWLYYSSWKKMDYLAVTINAK